MLIVINRLGILFLIFLPFGYSQIATLHKRELRRANNTGIRWRNLAVTIDDHDRSYTKTQFLLHPSSGFVANGSLCGIIGPSGMYSLNVTDMLHNDQSKINH